MPDNNRSEAARKGGEAVSEDREHMAEIGRKGGEKSGGQQSGGGGRGGSQQQRSEAGRKGGRQ